MNLHFFPSRRLAFYMAKLFLFRSLAVLLALIIVLQMLDLLGTSGKILRQPGNGDAEIWQYLSFRLPQLMALLLPFSVLLGTLITFATLNQNSEIVSMKAAGISAHQIIAPLVLASLGIAAFTFVFQDRVVTRATARLNAWEAVDYASLPPDRGIVSNVWVRHGDDLVHAATVMGQGAATRLRGVTIYDRSDGILRRIVSADGARPESGAWRLERVRIFDVDRGTVRTLPSEVGIDGADPSLFTLAKVSADEQHFARLRQSIADFRQAGRPTLGLEAELWHKISGSFSVVLMPLLAAVAAFGLARSGRLFLRVVIGMALGFAYFVADNFGLALGNIGAYSPLLAAWGPFVLFLLIGETVLIRTEE